MDLPATQAFEDEDFASTQQIATKDTENSLVGTLHIGDNSYSIISGVTTTIGRHPGNKIVISDETVSKWHAEIEAYSVDGTIFMKDLNSSNRSKINGTKLGKPNCAYQIKNDDKLSFGAVLATFKLYRAIDDSLILCTPQVNQKDHSIIPSTPDSSMNNSSASEHDVSIIPGTQTDKTDLCFRLPQVPTRTSTSNEHKLPEFGLDDLPSPLSKNKMKPDNISEVETQRFSVSDTNEDFENSLYTAQTQKAVATHKLNHSDENIYELETQRPINADNVSDDIENLNTQKFDPSKSISVNRKSADVSIYSVETQKTVPEPLINDDINDLETQRFTSDKADSATRKSVDLSIYSAATQKTVSEITVSNDIENLETQQFTCDKVSTRKSANVSIYSAETQKANTSIYSAETQKVDISIYSAETQKAVPETSIIGNQSRKSAEVSIYSAETQKAVLETSVIGNQSGKSIDVSIYSAETQKLIPETPMDESLENVETQQFDVTKSGGFKTPNLQKRKSSRKSMYEAETQKCITDSLVDEPLEEAETQRFHCEKSNMDKSESRNTSIYDAETQKIIPDTRKSTNKSLHSSEAEKCVDNELDDESLEDVETQQFITNASSLQTPASAKRNINKSLYEVKLQNSSCKDLINELSKTIDEDSRMVSSLSVSVKDMETLPFVEDKLPLENIRRSNTQELDEFSCDSGFRTAQESEVSKTNSSVTEDHVPTLQNEKSFESSSTRKTNTTNNPDKEDNNKIQITDNSSLPKLDKSKSDDNFNNAENTDEDIDEDEMFCSQNLIQGCPFSFMPEDSLVDDDKTATTSRKSNEIEEHISKEKTNDKILDASINVSNKSRSQNQKLLPSKEMDIKTSDQINETDSETDEEGAFSSHLSKEADTVKSDDKKDENDSETDEEGIFSNSFSRENSIKKLSATKNSNIQIISNASKEVDIEKSGNKTDENDSETDEEGIFSNSFSKENSTNQSSAIKSTDILRKLDDTNNQSFSETNVKNKNDVIVSNTENLKSRQSSSIREKSPTPDSEDNLFDDDDDDDKGKTNCIQQSEKISSKSDTDNAPTSKTGNLSLNQIDNDKTSSNYANTNEEVNELAPTQIVESNVSDTEDIHLAPTQVINVSKSRINEFDDLAPTQIIDKQTSTNKSFVADSDTDDEFLAPTQIISTSKQQTSNDDAESLFLAATQIIPRAHSPMKENDNEFDSLDLAPIQIIDTQTIGESLLPTENVDKKSSNLDIVELTKNSSIKGLDKTTPTPVINKTESKILLNSSKRQLEEIEITCNKKLKATGGTECVKVNLNSMIEKDLNEMFEGPAEKPVNHDEESVLLTQQLANILESSQLDNSLETELNTSLPSPTLSNKRRCNIKNRNRGKSLVQTTSSSGQRQSLNLNDTIERNLNEMFDDSINSMESCEDDVMMTQQLKNILSSQDDEQSDKKKPSIKDKSVSEPVNSEKKKHRLSLLINLNTSKTSNNQSGTEKTVSSTVQSNSIPDKEKATSQSNSVEGESQDTQDYFANLKTKKKRNVIQDSQSDEETRDQSLSSGSDREIVYKRGTRGFSDAGRPVSTKECVAFLEPKGRSFTSDSQSDAEEIISYTLTNSPTLSGKKRFNLSLQKNVHRNLSQSSASDLETERKSSVQVKNRQSLVMAKKTGNSKSRSSSSSRRSVKRVLARGTRGFLSNSLPVESEELVSAASTESDEDPRSSTTIDKKVCTPNYPNLAVRSKECVKTEDVRKNDGNVGSDDDFLEDMPDIKVAGTAECPPTNSQLAAVSDDEDTVSNKSLSITIPKKWTWYAQQRFDLIYKTNKDRKNSEDENSNDKEVVKSPAKEEKVDPKPSIEQLLAEIESKPVTKKHFNKSLIREDNSETDSDAKTIDETRITTRGRSARFKRKSDKSIENSPRLGIQVLRNSIENSSLVKDSDNESNDSDVSTISTISAIIPKYKPLEPLNINKMLQEANIGNNDDLDDDDREFQQLAQKCAKVLAMPNVYTAPQVQKNKVGQSTSKVTPTKARRGRPPSASVNNCSSLNITRSGAHAMILTPSKCKSSTVHKDTFVFQVSGDSTKGDRTSTSTTKSGLTIVRNKRSATAVATTAATADDIQNQPPKRTKTAKDLDCTKLQQLSPATGVTATVAEKKGTIKAPRTLDNYVVLHKSASKNDSSDLSAVENSVIEETNKSGTKPKKAVGSRTTSRAAAASLKNKKIDSFVSHSNNSSKENLAVEDSDNDSVFEKPKARTSKRNKTVDSSVTAKSTSGKEDISVSEVENEKTKKTTRGRATRQNVKKDVSTKETAKSKKVISVIQDSDSDFSDQSEFGTQRGNRNKRIVNAKETVTLKKSTVLVKESNSAKSDNGQKEARKKRVEKSNSMHDKKDTHTVQRPHPEQSEDNFEKLEININKSTRSTRGKNAKNPDLEQSDNLEKSEVNVNKSTRSRRGKNFKNSESGQSDNLEKSEASVNQTTRSRRGRTTKNTDSEQSDNLEKSETKVNKSTRSRRGKDIVKAESDQSDNNKGTRSRRVIKNKDSEEDAAKKSSATATKETKNRRGKARDQSSDSVFTESSDNDKEKKLFVSSDSIRPVRQTRKRPIAQSSILESNSSAESQEISNILENCDVSAITSTRSRRGRLPKKDNFNSSEDTQDSEDSRSQTVNTVSEKSVSRSKRPRLNNTTKNKSSTQQSLNDNNDSKVLDSPKRSTMTRNDSVLTSSSSHLMPRRSMSVSPSKGSRHRVLFTGERSEAHRQIVMKLGGSEVESPGKCSVLVTDKVRRTFKFLCSLARGIPIVSVNWLEDSKNANRFLDWETYILKDPVAEGKFKFNLETSLEKARKQKLFEGYNVLLTSNITQPPVSELKEMVMSSGGKPLLRAPAKWPSNTVIVTKEDDLKNAAKLFTKAPKSVSIYSTEFILTGILRQNVNLQEFKLSV